MENPIDRLEVFSKSSLRRCRSPQFSVHFRGELRSFNVGNAQNEIALNFISKNSVFQRRRFKRKNEDFVEEEERENILTSKFCIRYPELRSGGTIAVSISYEGDWNRSAVLSLIFAIYSKKLRRLSYSNGEIYLSDDLRDDGLCIPLLPRGVDASDDLKAPVSIHLIVDVWDALAGPKEPIKTIDLLSTSDEQQDQQSSENTEPVMFQRIESSRDKQNDDDEINYWPGSTDFLIEIPIPAIENQPCQCVGESCGNYSILSSKQLDENDNVVINDHDHNHHQHDQVRSPSVKFYCHRSKLAGASTAFDELFNDDYTRDTNVLRLRKISPEAAELFLNFIYAEKCELPFKNEGAGRYDYETLVEVISLADRYECDQLKEYLDILLTDRYLSLKTAADRTVLADQYELPCLGQSSLSLLAWSLDDEYMKLLYAPRGHHLMNEVIKEASRKHLFTDMVVESRL